MSPLRAARFTSRQRKREDAGRVNYRHNLIKRHMDEHGNVICECCKETIEGKPTIHHQKPWKEIHGEITGAADFSDLPEEEQKKRLRDAYWDVANDGENLQILCTDCHRKEHAQDDALTREEASEIELLINMSAQKKPAFAEKIESQNNVRVRFYGRR